MRKIPLPPPRFDWDDIDTVLLDMDGTLLDLRFDNYFWQELVPQAYATKNALSLDATHAQLGPLFTAHRGQLTWYCTDFWSQQLGLDIVSLKRNAQGQVAWRRGAEEFLRRIRAMNKRLILATNAHHDTLEIKHSQTGLIDYFDAVVSSHSYGYPKEHRDFWHRLEREQQLNLARCVFVDDSLPVLHAAKAHGVAQVIAVTQPDSGQAPRQCEEFVAINDLAELLE
jgi:5'-nucleotidase